MATILSGRSRSVEQRPQRHLERGVDEGVALLGQDPREHPLAGEEQRVGELSAEEELGAERRHGQQRRPVQDLAEHLGHGGVGDGLRGREVHRSGDVVVEQPPQGAHLVVEADPAPPLLAGTHPPADPELEEGEQLGQGAAVGGQHDARARVGDPDAGLGGGRGGGLPLRRRRRRGSPSRERSSSVTAVSPVSP